MAVVGGGGTVVGTGATVVGGGAVVGAGAGAGAGAGVGAGAAGTGAGAAGTGAAGGGAGAWTGAGAGLGAATTAGRVVAATGGGSAPGAGSSGATDVVVEPGSVELVAGASTSVREMVVSTVSVGASSSDGAVEPVAAGSGVESESGVAADEVSGPITGMRAVNPAVAATVAPIRVRWAGKRRRAPDRAALSAAIRSSVDSSVTSTTVRWLRSDSAACS